MSKRSDKEYLQDILTACENILSYKEGYDFDMFMGDRKTQDAIVRNIEIIGEAVKNISKSLKEKYAEIEWKEIAKTRDKLIHSYFGVDLDIVWDIVSVDIPKLKGQIKEIIQKEGVDREKPES